MYKKLSILITFSLFIYANSNDEKIRIGQSVTFENVKAKVVKFGGYNHPECKLAISNNGKYFYLKRMNSTCKKAINSKGVNIICNSNKRICKTRPELVKAVQKSLYSDNDIKLRYGKNITFDKIKAKVVKFGGYNMPECKLAISLDGKYFFLTKMNSTCKKDFNSKGVKIICNSNKAICKTRNELIEFVKSANNQINLISNNNYKNIKNKDKQNSQAKIVIKKFTRINALGDRVNCISKTPYNNKGIINGTIKTICNNTLFKELLIKNGIIIKTTEFFPNGKILKMKDEIKGIEITYFPDGSILKQKKFKSKLKIEQNSKWIDPTSEYCHKYNGKTNGKIGICFANIDNAKKICSSLGGRLPTLKELKKVIINCGGKIVDILGKEKLVNVNNSNYQSCRKEKGFDANGISYWSSDIIEYNSNHQNWSINFEYGYKNGYPDNQLIFRCIK